MSLLEWILALLLLSILSTGILTTSTLPFQENCHARIALQALYAARTQALATDTTHQIVIAQTKLRILNAASPVWEYDLYPSLARLNVSALGFKSSGRTSTAGTVSIGSKPYLITLGVGFGKPNIK